jgi:hypothetical protein
VKAVPGWTVLKFEATRPDWRFEQSKEMKWQRKTYFPG